MPDRFLRQISGEAPYDAAASEANGFITQDALKAQQSAAQATYKQAESGLLGFAQNALNGARTQAATWQRQAEDSLRSIQADLARRQEEAAMQRQEAQARLHQLRPPDILGRQAPGTSGEDDRVGLPEAPITTEAAMSLDTSGMGGVNNQIASAIGENSAAVEASDKAAWRENAEGFTQQFFQETQGREPTPEELAGHARSYEQGGRLGQNIAGAGPVKGGLDDLMGLAPRYGKPISVVDELPLPDFTPARIDGKPFEVRLASARRSFEGIDPATRRVWLEEALATGDEYAPIYRRLLEESRGLPAVASAPTAPRLPAPGASAALPPPSTVRGIGKAVDRLSSTDVPEGAAPIALDAAEEVARLRLDKFPEDVRPLIQEAAERMNFATGQRRGVISDEAAEGMADELGRTTEQWLRQGKAGKAYSTEEARALANAITSQATRIKDLTAEQTALGRANVTDTQLAQLLIEGDKLAALTALREGARAEAGRALRAFRQEARLGVQPDDAISQIFAKVGGRDNALRFASEYQTLIENGATPIQLAKFWAQVGKPPKVSAEDWFKALRYNAMLSGPRSFEIDVAGTAAEIPWKLARDFGASLGRSVSTRSTEPLREMVPEIAGIWEGAAKGGNALLEALAHGITTEQAMRGDLPNDIISRVENPAAKAAAWSLEWVTRLKGGLNELQLQTAYGMAKGRLAGNRATREGLTGQRWSERVSELIENPDRALDLQAMDQAKTITYADEMGTVGRAIQSLRSGKGPWGDSAAMRVAGHIILPFFPTVYKITSRGIDRSPLGLAGTAIDVARGKYVKGKELEKGLRPLSDRLGDNLMGTAIGAYFVGQAAAGNVSAAGPENARERDVLRAQGWQPYSVRIGGRWVSYANWGPVAMSLAGAASIAEANQYKSPKDTALNVTADALRRFGEVFSEQTYLQGVGAIYKAFKEPERYGESFLNGFMSSLIPEGALINTVGQAFDPVARRPIKGDIGSAIAMRLPGKRGDLPIARDILGNVEQNPYAGLSALSPVRVAPPSEEGTANLRRFVGSPSAAEDYRIAQAIDRVTKWRNAPREHPKPTAQEITLHNRYKGKENQRYERLVQLELQRRRREQLSAKTAGQEASPIAAVARGASQFFGARP